MDKTYILAKDLNPCYIKDKYFNDKDFYSIDELIGIIEDLDADLEKLQEEYEDYKNYVSDNYRQISYEEQIGWSEHTRSV